MIELCSELIQSEDPDKWQELKQTRFIVGSPLNENDNTEEERADESEEKKETKQVCETGLLIGF